MTDLQMALVALGALIIIGVLLFNWWQERSLRNEISRPFEETPRDPLMDEFRLDPEAIPVEKLQRNALDHDTIPTEPQVAAAPVREPFPPTIPQEIDTNADYGESINDAASAVAEFEEDMAVAVKEEEVSAIRQTYMEENVLEDDVPDVAPTEELLQEAGLDVAAPAAEKVPAKEDVALPPEVNQQIDLIALLYLNKPASGLVLREYLLTLTDLDKPVYGYGLDASGHWQILTREQESVSFKAVLCTLQLVDRSGAVSRESLNRFQQAVTNMGQTLGATAEWGGSPDPLNYAAELDKFCVDVDKLVGFSLAQGINGPFTGTKLRGLAEAAGLVLRSDGAFHYESENGLAQFALVNKDGTPFSADMLRTALISGVTFQLDIPHVANCAEVFNQMILAARQMESSLGGQLVDANQKPLGEVQLEKIRQELKTIHAKMVARSILPGSVCARRLFS
jgi:FtsZ-interacting cell division protein ZipA